jgi:hypothetical protein
VYKTISSVKHCKQISKLKGRTYLAHREHLHTGLSGLNFILTLIKATCRKKLCGVAEIVAPLIDRLLRARGRVGLTATEFLRIGNAIQSVVVLAIHNGTYRTMGAYNAMDANRCFDSVCLYLLRCKEIVYTEAVHEWMLSKQSAKFRAIMVKDLFYFGIQKAADMTRTVKKLRKLHPTMSVTPSTVFILYCELRQVINKFTLSGVKALCLAFASSQSAQRAVQKVKDRLLREDDGKDSHTVQVFQAIVDHLKFDFSKTRQVSATPQEVVDLCAKHELCPKLFLENIPEWSALHDVLSGILLKCSSQQSYSDVTAAATAYGLSVF